MEKPKIAFHSAGRSGNIFFILGMVSTALHEQQRIADFNEMRDRALEAKSYEDALAVIREYVDLKDEDGRY